MTESERLSAIVALTEQVVNLYNCNGGFQNEKLIETLKNEIFKLADVR